MMRKDKKKHGENKIILFALGIIFLIWGIIAIANSLMTEPAQILWFCYLGLVLIGIGIFMGNGGLIGSQIAILGIPLIFWDIDFIYRAVSGLSLLGITDYFLVNRPILSQLISAQHLFTLPLALYALYLVKVKKTDFWKISIAEVIALFFASYLFSKPESNINCVFRSCVNVDIGLPYKIEWFLVFFVLIIVINFILSKMKFLFKKK